MKGLSFLLFLLFLSPVGHTSSDKENIQQVKELLLKELQLHIEEDKKSDVIINRFNILKELEKVDQIESFFQFCYSTIRRNDQQKCLALARASISSIVGNNLLEQEAAKASIAGLLEIQNQISQEELRFEATKKENSIISLLSGDIIYINNLISMALQWQVSRYKDQVEVENHLLLTAINIGTTLGHSLSHLWGLTKLNLQSIVNTEQYKVTQKILDYFSSFSRMGNYPMVRPSLAPVFDESKYQIELTEKTFLSSQKVSEIWNQVKIWVEKRKRFERLEKLVSNEMDAISSKSFLSFDDFIYKHPEYENFVSKSEFDSLTHFYWIRKEITASSIYFQKNAGKHVIRRTENLSMYLSNISRNRGHFSLKQYQQIEQILVIEKLIQNLPRRIYDLSVHAWDLHDSDKQKMAVYELKSIQRQLDEIPNLINNVKIKVGNNIYQNGLEKILNYSHNFYPLMKTFFNQGMTRGIQYSLYWETVKAETDRIQKELRDENFFSAKGFLKSLYRIPEATALTFGPLIYEYLSRPIHFLKANLKVLQGETELSTLYEDYRNNVVDDQAWLINEIRSFSNFIGVGSVLGSDTEFARSSNLDNWLAINPLYQVGLGLTNGLEGIHELYQFSVSSLLGYSRGEYLDELEHSFALNVGEYSFYCAELALGIYLAIQSGGVTTLGTATAVVGRKTIQRQIALRVLVRSGALSTISVTGDHLVRSNTDPKYRFSFENYFGDIVKGVSGSALFMGIAHKATAITQGHLPKNLKITKGFESFVAKKYPQISKILLPLFEQVSFGEVLDLAEASTEINPLSTKWKQFWEDENKTLSHILGIGLSTSAFMADTMDVGVLPSLVQAIKSNSVGPTRGHRTELERLGLTNEQLENSQLNDRSREEKARHLLSELLLEEVELTEYQKVAIKEAHNINGPAFSSLFKKAQILKQAGFGLAEIRALIESNLVGTIEAKIESLTRLFEEDKSNTHLATQLLALRLRIPTSTPLPRTTVDNIESIGIRGFARPKSLEESARTTQSFLDLGFSLNFALQNSNFFPLMLEKYPSKTSPTFDSIEVTKEINQIGATIATYFKRLGLVVELQEDQSYYERMFSQNSNFNPSEGNYRGLEYIHMKLSTMNGKYPFLNLESYNVQINLNNQTILLAPQNLHQLTLLTRDTLRFFKGVAFYEQPTYDYDDRRDIIAAFFHLINSNSRDLVRHLRLKFHIIEDDLVRFNEVSLIKSFENLEGIDFEVIEGLARIYENGFEGVAYQDEIGVEVSGLFEHGANEKLRYLVLRNDGIDITSIFTDAVWSKLETLFIDHAIVPEDHPRSGQLNQVMLNPALFPELRNVILGTEIEFFRENSISPENYFDVDENGNYYFALPSYLWGIYKQHFKKLESLRLFVREHDRGQGEIILEQVLSDHIAQKLGALKHNISELDNGQSENIMGQALSGQLAQQLDVLKLNSREFDSGVSEYTLGQALRDHLAQKLSPDLKRQLIQEGEFHLFERPLGDY